jgi:hypothetical protein
MIIILLLLLLLLVVGFQLFFGDNTKNTKK